MCSAGLPSNVRSRSGQPCSPFEAGALPVLRPARPRFRFGLTRASHESPTSGGYRRIHIRLRGRVLCNPPRLKGFRTPARASPSATPLRSGGYRLAAPTVTAQCTLGNWANVACVRRSLRGKARLLPRAASSVSSAILRRRNTGFSSRSRPLAHHANCRRAVPLRLLLTHATLARPSRRRVFLRSICARRCSIDSLNVCRGLGCLKSHFPAAKVFYDLRLDLRFVWYNGCELGDGH